MQSIWRNIKKYHDEGEVTFQRLNSKKEHEPRKYYYIWKIWEKLYKTNEEQQENLNETTPNNNQQLS